MAELDLLLYFKIALSRTYTGRPEICRQKDQAQNRTLQTRVCVSVSFAYIIGLFGFDWLVLKEVSTL